MIVVLSYYLFSKDSVRFGAGVTPKPSTPTIVCSCHVTFHEEKEEYI